MKTALIKLVGLVSIQLTASSASAETITDAALLRYVAKPFNRVAMMNKRVVLGRNKGVTVVADHPCSDVCPAYTTRIVHYVAEPGLPCTNIGGVVVRMAVPFSIAVMMKEFCVPRAIAGKRHSPV